MYPLNDTEEEEQPSGQQCAGPLPRQPRPGADQHRHVQLQPPAAHPGPVLRRGWTQDGGGMGGTHSRAMFRCSVNEASVQCGVRFIAWHNVACCGTRGCWIQSTPRHNRTQTPPPPHPPPRPQPRTAQRPPCWPSPGSGWSPPYTWPVSDVWWGLHYTCSHSHLKQGRHNK